jgi:hypothetical protein
LSSTKEEANVLITTPKIKIASIGKEKEVS